MNRESPDVGARGCRLGFETALALAGHGAAVVLACRDTGKADTAAGRIRDTVPGAAVRVLPLDLGSLASVREAAAQLHADHPRRAYGQSKLANLMFTYELQRRLAAAGAQTSALAGSPVPVESSARSRDIHAQDRLWELSEQLTGVTYQIPGRAPRHTATPRTARDS